jgi:hypothetical protein
VISASAQTCHQVAMAQQQRQRKSDNRKAGGKFALDQQPGRRQASCLHVRNIDSAY